MTHTRVTQPCSSLEGREHRTLYRAKSWCLTSLSSSESLLRGVPQGFPRPHVPSKVWAALTIGPKLPNRNIGQMRANWSKVGSPAPALGLSRLPAPGPWREQPASSHHRGSRGVSLPPAVPRAGLGPSAALQPLLTLKWRWSPRLLSLPAPSLVQPWVRINKSRGGGGEATDGVRSEGAGLVLQSPLSSQLHPGKVGVQWYPTIEPSVAWLDGTTAIISFNLRQEQLPSLFQPAAQNLQLSFRTASGLGVKTPSAGEPATSLRELFQFLSLS